MCAPGVLRSGTENSFKVTECVKLTVVGPFVCSLLSRSMSSRRRNATPRWVSSAWNDKSSWFLVDASPSEDFTDMPPELSEESQLCTMSSSAEARSFSSFWSIVLMKSSQTGSNLRGYLGPFVLMSFSSLKGKRPSKRPYMMIPSAQMSTFKPYCLSKISGDQKILVPTSLESLSPLLRTTAVPKSLSAILHCVSVMSSRSMRKLSPLMSRCTIFLLCKYCMAAAIWKLMWTMFLQLILPRSLRWSCMPSTKSPPEYLSMTMHTKHRSKKTA
mmetsp:Transcript_8324/g.14783  ORF Transcript_8324/g.14783 Transcript_8324/m.14783 type:complete len:272 (+) Transcript_8324:287-1102(+)